MSTWKIAIRSKSFRVHLLVCILGIAALVTFLPRFFQEYILPKPGIQLNDWFLNLFAPADYSIAIFILIYGGIVFFIIRHWRQSEIILMGLEAYVILQVLRIASLSILTLEPPIGIISLVDPFIAKVAYGASVFDKDLFFSGHTATLFLLLLLERNKTGKYILCILTVIVAILLILQRVHYTLDIVAAPLAAYLAYFTASHVVRVGRKT